MGCIPCTVWFNNLYPFTEDIDALDDKIERYPVGLEICPTWYEPLKNCVLKTFVAMLRILQLTVYLRT